MKIKNEAELLNKFYYKDNVKKIFAEPFFNTDYGEVWSTDGFSVVQINPKVLVNEYPKKAVRIPMLGCSCKKKITIEAINKALDACPKDEEEIVIQDAVECEDCNGTGEVTWDYIDHHGHTHEKEFLCPTCNGEGEIEPKKTKKTGKFITDEYAVINIGNAYFYAHNIIKLKFAMDFLGITSVELTYNPEKAGNEFVLSEDVRIRLMPMLYDDLIPCDATIKLSD